MVYLGEHVCRSDMDLMVSAARAVEESGGEGVFGQHCDGSGKVCGR